MGSARRLPIRLSNGVVIRDPRAFALRFLGGDSGYLNYDRAPVAMDATLTESDVRVANRFAARMSPAIVAGIMTRRGAVEAALRRIPPEASLSEDDVAIPWAALGELVAAFDGLSGVGLGRITKVLHRKRPALIPILDSVVVRFLASVEGEPLPRRLLPADRAIALTRTYKREMDRNREALASLRAAMAAEGFDLTECRLFDIFAWSFPNGPVSPDGATVNTLIERGS
jgi:hypothetical protein